MNAVSGCDLTWGVLSPLSLPNAGSRYIEKFEALSLHKVSYNSISRKCGVLKDVGSVLSKMYRKAKPQ